MKRHGAFTIVELLVVIATIIILMSLLFPAFRHMKEASNVTGCEANMSMIGRALLAYVADNDRLFPAQNIANQDSMIGWVGRTGITITWPAGSANPGATNTYGLIYRQLRPLNQYLPIQGNDVFAALCPADEAMKNVSQYRAYDIYGTSYITNVTHDGMNPNPCRLTNNANGKVGLPYLVVKKPSRMIAMGEFGAFHIGVAAVKWHKDARETLLFVDGHVARYFVTDAEFAALSTPQWTFRYDK